METAAAVLTTTIRSHVSLHCPAAPRRRRLWQPCGGGGGGGRIIRRALPSAEVMSEILSPKLVPGSPSDTGDVSSLVPVSALMLLFYFVSNWVVPELLMKRLKEPNRDDDDEPSAAVSAAAAASMSDGGGADDDAGSPRKIRLKVKKKKNGKATIVKV